MNEGLAFTQLDSFPSRRSNPHAYAHTQQQINGTAVPLKSSNIGLGLNTNGPTKLPTVIAQAKPATLCTWDFRGSDAFYICWMLKHYCYFTFLCKETQAVVVQTCFWPRIISSTTCGHSPMLARELQTGTLMTNCMQLPGCPTSLATGRQSEHTMKPQ